MEAYFDNSATTRVYPEVADARQVVVVGAGQAGCAAALAGARGGLKVLLTEASGALGGAAVNCLVNPFMPNATTLKDSNGEERTVNLSQGMYREFSNA